MSSETIINWLDEVDDEISDAESIVSDHESEYEQVISEVSEDETDSSEYSSNETVEQNISSQNFHYGKTGTNGLYSLFHRDVLDLII